MLKKIEALFFGGQWRRDEHAWRVWQEVEPAIPTRLPEPEDRIYPREVMRMAGRVTRIYQHARRGSKALIDFGPAVGIQDTWWEDARPPVGHWVIVHAHLWLPPGTHSDGQVLWVDHWESWAPGDVLMRARRHQQRMEREARRQGAAPLRTAQPPIWGRAPSQPTEGGDFQPGSDPMPPRADEREQPDVLIRVYSSQLGLATVPSVGPLFQTTAIAVDAGMDQVMSTASEIAAGLGARTYGPTGVGGGRLLCLWPVVEEPTFASVTARPMHERGSWVGVSAQSLHMEALDIVGELSGALQSRLGALGSGASPPELARDYDRGGTRKLESEIQELLQKMVADPSAWEHLCRAIYEREVLLQHLTELGA